MCYLPLMTISTKKKKQIQKKISLDSFHRYWSSKNLAIRLDQRHNYPHSTKRGPLTYYLHLITISIYKKSKTMSDFSQRYWWPKNPTIWLDKKHNWPHPTKVLISDAAFSWWLTPGKKTEINIYAKTVRLLGSLQRYW